MRIHIIGGPGSGKSYVARRLSEGSGVKYYELDDIVWGNHPEPFGVKASIESRDTNLKTIPLVFTPGSDNEIIDYSPCRVSLTEHQERLARSQAISLAEFILRRKGQWSGCEKRIPLTGIEPTL